MQGAGAWLSASRAVSRPGGGGWPDLSEVGLAPPSPKVADRRSRATESEAGRGIGVVCDAPLLPPGFYLQLPASCLLPNDF